ncbi:MAG TPA: hypothetical protein V6D10_07245 [Trichocoleus sp.]|jgi:CheY-like chemotaxis protein
MQQQTALPTIFVLEPDDEVRPVLTQNLKNWGYQVVMACNESDAMQRVQKHRRFNLILLNQFRQSIEESRAIGQLIRKAAGLDGHTSIVIMAEQYGADLEGQDIQVGEGECVTYLEDGEQLKRLLYRLCPGCSNSLPN